MKKILHLLYEEKIAASIIENFSATLSESYFLIFDSEGLVLRQGNFSEKIENLDIDRLIRKNAIQSIIVHGLFPRFVDIICKQTEVLPIAWFVWGFDIYNQGRVKHLLYERRTKQYFKRYSGFKGILKNILSYSKLLRWVSRSEAITKQSEIAHSKIDYFCSYIEEDYFFFKNYFNNNIEFRYAPFCTMSQYLAGSDSVPLLADATNILLGNSNSAENNHVDAIVKLSDLGFENGSCIVPLSYGFDYRYKLFVLNNGRKLLGKRFIPLLDFIDKASYLQMLSSCSAAVFYHNRQQAMGNIIALLDMGVRVYLSSKNPVFKFCKRVGLHVYDFDRDFQVYKNQKLDEKLVLHNKGILHEMFNRQRVIKDLNELIRSL